MIDTSNFERVDDEVGKLDVDDSGNRISLINEGYDFLNRHAFCLRINRTYLCDIWEGVLAILLFEIDPRKPGIDDSVWWVIVGDIPPAYLDVVSSPTPWAALDVYLEIVEEWAETVERGESVTDLMPIYVRYSNRLVESTLEYAEMLKSRASFIRENILPELS